MHSDNKHVKDSESLIVQYDDHYRRHSSDTN